MHLPQRLLLIVAAILADASPASAQTKAETSGKSAVEAKFLFNADRKPASFELLEGHIWFRAQVEEREVWALLDNGADRSFIDIGFARSLGLQLAPSAGRVLTPRGSLEISIASDVDVVIPGQMSLRGSVAAVDLSTMSRMVGREVGLVLGAEAFKAMAVAIRPGDKTFEFWPSAALDLPGAPRLPIPEDARELVLKNDTPHLEISIAGQPAVVTVDLGSNGVISLNEAAWVRLGLDKVPTTEGKSAGIEGHQTVTQTAIVPDISVGPVGAFDVPVTLQPVRARGGDGYLGMGYFSHFNFVIDIHARRIWLLSLVAGSSGASDAEPARESS